MEEQAVQWGQAEFCDRPADQNLRHSKTRPDPLGGPPGRASTPWENLPWEGLIIEWGDGYRAWVQRADLQDKGVIEIRRSAGDPPFPGFLEFSEQLSGLAAVPQSWRVTL